MHFADKNNRAYFVGESDLTWFDAENTQDRLGDVYVREYDGYYTEDLNSGN